MPASTLTSKGQTTIPRDVRNHLKLRTGDQIDFVIEPDGSVVIRPATVHVRELNGILRRKGMKHLSVNAMNAAVRKRFRMSR
jgi:AbrB family looped-hinge helix DNA binding protein